MKKDHTRDYTTEIFRLYARRKDEPILSGGQIADIAAADRTLRRLRDAGRDEIVRAVERIYFVQPFRPLRKKEITERVVAYAIACPTDERNVYRWLKLARTLCAYFRGLTLAAGEIEKIKAFIEEEKK